MIASLFVNIDAIRSVFATEDFADRISMLPSKFEITLLTELKQILSPFKIATEDLSGRLRLSFSFIFFYLHKIPFGIGNKKQNIRVSNVGSPEPLN